MLGSPERDEGDVLVRRRARGAAAAAAQVRGGPGLAPPPSPSGVMSNARRSIARSPRAVAGRWSRPARRPSAVVGATTRSACLRTAAAPRVRSPGSPGPTPTPVSRACSSSRRARLDHGQRLREPGLEGSRHVGGDADGRDAWCGRGRRGSGPGPADRLGLVAPGRRTGSGRARRRGRPGASSSRWVPRSTIRPPSTTSSWSAWRTVERRWAITSEVRPARATPSARCTAASDSESRWAVASSRTTTSGALRMSRARATRCFSPPESR